MIIKSKYGSPMLGTNPTMSGTGPSLEDCYVQRIQKKSIHIHSYKTNLVQTLLRLASASTPSYILFEVITQVFFMIIPLLFKAEYRATTQLPTHVMSSLLMGVVLARFNMLEESIPVVQALNTEGASKFWMGNPMGMLFHVFW